MTASEIPHVLLLLFKNDQACLIGRTGVGTVLDQTNPEWAIGKIFWDRQARYPGKPPFATKNIPQVGRCLYLIG